IRCRAESFQRVREEGGDIEILVDNGYLGDGSQGEISSWTAKYMAALGNEPINVDEFPSYFDLMIEVLEESGAQVISDQEG
ncbi:MAG: hypothetical protein N2C14_22995, partial [Planctomycetales bacterium]